jgi:hypothetical protein
LVPVPALTPDSVIWYGDADTVPDVDLTLLSMMELVAVPLLVVAEDVVDDELVPTLLIADTLYVYAVLAVRPESEYVVDTEPVLDCTVDHVVLPLVDRSILYPVTAEPPLLDGATQLRLICDEDTVVAVSPVGDPGTVDKVVAEVVLEGALVPTLLIAETR